MKECFFMYLKIKKIKDIFLSQLAKFDVYSDMCFMT